MKNEILFFASFSEQRRELREIWNETNSDWKEFLKNSELKILKVSDALGISLHQLSKKHSVNELLETYKSLYKL